MPLWSHVPLLYAYNELGLRVKVRNSPPPRSVLTRLVQLVERLMVQWILDRTEQTEPRGTQPSPYQYNFNQFESRACTLHIRVLPPTHLTLLLVTRLQNHCYYNAHTLQHGTLAVTVITELDVLLAASTDYGW